MSGAGPKPGHPALSVQGLSLRFGGVAALTDVGFEIASGETCGLIGPNGAGKTSLFNCVSGLYRPQSGEIRVGGRQLVGLPPHRTAELGVGRTFQNVALYPTLSAVENVMAGGHIRMRAGFLETAVRSSRSRREESAMRDRAMQLLELVGLGSRSAEPVGALPFGHQKRVELARALATSPQLLLLDEPAAGLNPTELDDFIALVGAVQTRFRLSILLVEHHLGLVMALCQKVVALNFGRKVADGPPDAVRSHPEVVRAYLGDAP